MMPTFARSLKPAWLGAGVTCLLGLWLQTGIVMAQNLVTNPGFETGDTTGWFGFGSPAISAQTGRVHSGNYAGLVQNRTASYMGIAQSFQSVLQNGQTYNVSAWLQLVSGTNQTMQLTMQQVDGGGTGYTLIAAGTVSTNGWTQLTGQFTGNYSGTLTSLVLYAEMPSSSNAAYYIDDVSVQSAAVTPASGQCLVDGGTVFQRIDGFGASSAWRANWTTSQADMFFSTNTGTGTALDGTTHFPFTGIGLSLLRNHVSYAGYTAAGATPGKAETSIMQMAQARGARVWSAPWTPASGFKSNNGPNGGNYLGSGNNATNLAYAAQLANYLAAMKGQGINIYALSLQNEPDANVTTYEACVWTGVQLHDFVTNLYSAMVARGVSSTRIILPESQNWGSNTGLLTPTLNDPNAAAAVSIVADHNYVPNNQVGDTTTPAPLPSAGKSTWETEVSQLGGTYDGSITNAIYWAGRIHLFLTAAQVNAWHYWWLIPGNADNEGLTDSNGIPAKRFYALGQFARFVRPDFYRINVTNNTGSALVSAYKDSQSSNFAIVAINSSSVAVTQTFYLTNVSTVTRVVPWLTTGGLSLASQAAVGVTNASFAYTLPAWSVVTFAGQSAAATPPVLLPVATQTVDVGVAVNITNVASVSGSPDPSLNFTLLNGPTNATLTTANGTNGVFNWRPLVSQAGTTNLVEVVAADNQPPGLSATNSFILTVRPLAQPVLGPLAVSSGRFSLVVSGPQGPDYKLLMSTNLTGGWEVLYTTNSPATPVTLLDTNSNDRARFYRIQLGP